MLHSGIHHWMNFETRFLYLILISITVNVLETVIRTVFEKSITGFRLILKYPSQYWVLVFISVFSDLSSNLNANIHQCLMSLISISVLCLKKVVLHIVT
jgi:hypothetical protein